MLLPYVALLATWDLAARLGPTLVWVAVALASLAWATRWRAVPPLSVLLGVAVVMRLLLVPLPATLSNDVFRYLWDGRVAAAGENPYALAPDAPELASSRDELWERLDHRDVETVYPPLALTLFTLAARFPWPLLTWKLIVVVADLAGCFFLFRLAEARGNPPSRVIWYAWNPLVAIESAGMGHLDAIGVCWVIVAVWALTTRRAAAGAALAAAAGVLTKLVPLVVLPAWMARSARPWAFAAVCALALGFAFAPVVTGSGGVPSGYVRFGVSWEFNGPIYEPLWRGLERIDTRSMVAGALDRQKERSGEHDRWNRFYPWNYARMHARLLLAALLAVLLAVAWRRTDPCTGTGLAFEAVLLCSATVYPWYLLWLLPFAALERRRSWLVLCGCTFLAYVPQFTATPLMPWIFAALWGPYALIRLWEIRWSGA